MTLTRIEQLASGFAWATFFEGPGIGLRHRYIVAQPEAIAAEAAVFARTSVETIGDLRRVPRAARITTTSPRGP